MTPMTGLEILDLDTIATGDCKRKKIDDYLLDSPALWTTTDTSTYRLVAPQSMTNSNLHHLVLLGRSPKMIANLLHDFCLLQTTAVIWTYWRVAPHSMIDFNLHHTRLWDLKSNQSAGYIGQRNVLQFGYNSVYHLIYILVCSSLNWHWKPNSLCFVL